MTDHVEEVVRRARGYTEPITPWTASLFATEVRRMRETLADLELELAPRQPTPIRLEPPEARGLYSLLEAMVELVEGVDGVTREEISDAVDLTEQILHLEPETGPLSPRPRWDYLARATGAIERIRNSEPRYLSRSDALAAYLRDMFDALGLSIRDEATLYVALVTASTMVELASNGIDLGHTDEATVATVARVAQSFAAALLDYLPPEVRPGSATSP